MTPVGITSVIAGKILGVDDLMLVMSQLAWFIITIAIGVFLYQLVIMQLIYTAFVRKNPFKFYAGLAQGTLTAFAMASTWVVDLQTRARILREFHFACLTGFSVNVVIVLSDLVASVIPVIRLPQTIRTILSSPLPLLETFLFCAKWEPEFRRAIKMVQIVDFKKKKETLSS